MPVKVRCKGCQKVLTIPDKARGKKIRCPQCEMTIRVPTVRQKKAASEKSSDEGGVVAEIETSKAENTRMKTCPRCGAAAGEEDTDCPKCGRDLKTGKLSAAKKKLRADKVADPKDFSKEARNSAWSFLFDNKGLAIRGPRCIGSFVGW